MQKPGYEAPSLVARFAFGGDPVPRTTSFSLVASSEYAVSQSWLGHYGSCAVAVVSHTSFYGPISKNSHNLEKDNLELRFVS